MEKGKNKHFVCVECFTYNHASYIEDAMNGFTMQQTDFPFVCVVIDDASTDGEPNVIRRYLETYFDLEDNSITRIGETEDYTLTYARHKTNRNCFFAVILLKYNHYRKKSKRPYLKEWSESVEYIAMCEGDDYWTDPLKLQKQVCFLNDNPQYVICSHNFTRFYQGSLSLDKKTYYSKLFPEESSLDRIDYSLENYFDRWWTQPLTCVYRNGDYLTRIPYSSYPHFKDDVFYYYVLKEGRGTLLRDSMGVYRVHCGGVWSGASSIQHSQIAILNAFNIFSVEGADQAFNRINREEIHLLKTLFNQHSYWEVIKQLFCFGKMAPRKHFRSVVTTFGSYVKNKTKRKIRKFFKF